MDSKMFIDQFSTLAPEDQSELIGQLMRINAKCSEEHIKDMEARLANLTKAKAAEEDRLAKLKSILQA